ncbi:MAG: type II toxin-antitoxin system Phd/YefM family antitoxin [Armatimonadetes bacterium]|nr:type II toxin-antitoxin system Phd/YefM family antitoxin [Armatimonadota bacterium]
MTTVTSKNAQNKFGAMLDTAQKEPVTITRHDRPVAVVVSPERYAELEALEDSVWALRARMATKSGFLGTEETREFIERTLNADAQSVTGR